jgi:hypothetical protein
MYHGIYFIRVLLYRLCESETVDPLITGYYNVIYSYNY